VVGSRPLAGGPACVRSARFIGASNRGYFTDETGGLPAYAGSEAVCAIALGESPDGLVWPLCREESACPVAHIDVRTFNHTQTHQNPAH
jgi:hypothetical protein